MNNDREAARAYVCVCVCVCDSINDESRGHADMQIFTAVNNLGRRPSEG